MQHNGIQSGFGVTVHLAGAIQPAEALKAIFVERGGEGFGLGFRLAGEPAFTALGEDSYRVEVSALVTDADALRRACEARIDDVFGDGIYPTRLDLALAEVMLGWKKDRAGSRKFESRLMDDWKVAGDVTVPFWMLFELETDDGGKMAQHIGVFQGEVFENAATWSPESGGGATEAVTLSVEYPTGIWSLNLDGELWRDLDDAGKGDELFRLTAHLGDKMTLEQARALLAA